MQAPATIRLPLYAQVEDVLAERILSAEWKVGSQLPSEEELVREFGVSRTTIRSTIQSLIRRGLVEIRRGRGTFVAAQRITQDLVELTGFVEDMQLLGRNPTARLVAANVVSADAITAARLKLQVGTEVVRIHRVRLADGIPISFDETFLPEHLGRKLLADDLATEPIFTLLEQRYQTPLVEADYELEAAAASPATALALCIPPGSPIFLIDRTTYTTGRRPVDYERLHYRGDHIRFKTRLIRRPPRRSGQH
jgi:GntR family transcriptional regulator